MGACGSIAYSASHCFSTARQLCIGQNVGIWYLHHALRQQQRLRPQSRSICWRVCYTLSNGWGWYQLFNHVYIQMPLPKWFTLFSAGCSSSLSNWAVKCEVVETAWDSPRFWEIVYWFFIFKEIGPEYFCSILQNNDAIHQGLSALRHLSRLPNSVCKEASSVVTTESGMHSAVNVPSNKLACLILGHEAWTTSIRKARVATLVSESSAPHHCKSRGIILLKCSTTEILNACSQRNWIQCLETKNSSPWH